MSTIDTSSQSQLDSILKKLGVNAENKDKASNKDTLGQKDFLTLMTTQLQNQDPFAPMENAEFIAQMAQFSTVTGITEISETLKSMSAELGQFRMATAANLLGSSVLVPGNTARIYSQGEIHGVIDLPSASANTNLIFRDELGEVLHSEELGAQPAGLVGFAWMNIPAEIRNNNPVVTIDAYADMGGGMESLTPSVFADVMAAAVSQTENTVMLDVEDYGQVRADQVMKFRK